MCRHLKLPMESVIAVGDNSNDVEMLRAAGLPVAVGNAVPAVKALAKEITDDCDHDGGRNNHGKVYAVRTKEEVLSGGFFFCGN